MTFGRETYYEWRGARGPSLVGLVGAARVQFDVAGVRAALGQAEANARTCIAGARRVLPARYVGEIRRESPRPLGGLLADGLTRLPPGPVAVALSGGVDSAVLAALLRGRATAYTLVPALPGYSEEHEAVAVAERLGIALRRVHVSAEDYVRSLPAVISACECPLYNLHPVSRYLLARAVRADGCATLVTGDGADEVFRGTSGADYLPIVDALARAAGLQPFTPFLLDSVAPHVAADGDKRALRALALELGVPETIALHPKRPRFAPPIDLSSLWDGPRIAGLAALLGWPPAPVDDRDLVGRITLALLSREFPGLVLSCAA